MSSRNKLSKQPARIAIIHLNGTEDRLVFQRLVVVMEDFFLLVSRMTRTNRLPYFGFIVLSNQCKVFLPLQHVKGNHLKISMALSKLKWYLEDISNSHVPEDLDIIGVGIQEAVSLYYTQAQHQISTFGRLSQLELTILTTQPHKSTLLSSVKNAASRLDFQHIKKIETVFFKSVTLSSLMAVEDGNDSSSSYYWREDLEPSGFIEASTLDPTSVGMHSFFMSWLRNFDTDAEFLRIKFDSGFLIRCDAHERMLNPLSLTCPGTLDLSANLLDAGTSPFSRPAVAMETRGEDDGESVHELEVVALVDEDAICDSLIFGNPLILKATLCWKLDWDELENNQQNFRSLCFSLNSKRQVMILRLSQENPNPARASVNRSGIDRKIDRMGFPGSRLVRGKGNHSSSTPTSSLSSSSLSSSSSPSFQPHFILIPSDSCSFLLKSIATSEILIPVRTPPMGTCAESNQRAVEAELANVETLPMYNPFAVYSNLFASLRTMATGSSDEIGEDLIKSLPPAPKMRQASETSKKKDTRMTNRARTNSRSVDSSTCTLLSKQVAAPAQVRRLRAPIKRKLHDPGDSGLINPPEL